MKGRNRGKEAEGEREAEISGESDRRGEWGGVWWGCAVLGLCCVRVVQS